MAHDMAERRYTTQDGLSLFYRDICPAEAPAPDAAAVLCLPGLTRNSKDFIDLARHLAEGGLEGQARRVVCPDYRGRGRSDYDPQWRNYQGPTYIGDILHLLTALGLERVIVIGTSLGGLLALGLALTRPGCLAGVVLNDVGPDVPAEGLAPILTYVASDHVVADWEEATALLQSVFPELPAKTPEQWLTIARNTFREGEDGKLSVDWDPRLAWPLLRGLSPVPDLWPMFAALRMVPVLSVRGARSSLLAPGTVERMAALRQRQGAWFEAVEVPGVGHAPALTEEEVLEALGRFLTRIL